MLRTAGHPTTLFVVPCFNEEQRLPAAEFIAFLQLHPQLMLLFVDDGSRDQTLRVLHSIRDAVGTEQVQILALPNNGGKAEAIRQGMLHVLAAEFQERCPTALIGYLDADLATPLGEVLRLIDVALRRREIDVILGSRLSLQGHAVERTWKRKLLGRLFATAASLTMGMGIRDTQCGAKLFRYQNWLSSIFARPFLDRWLFDIEILTRIQQRLGQQARQIVYECPLEVWQEIGGSRLKARDFLKAPWKLFRLALEYRVWPLLAGNNSASVSPALPVTEAVDSPILLPYPTASATSAVERKTA
jgi:dolichyl-phosphate beta-glucosyltransferase